VSDPAIRAALAAGARDMGNAVEWQHLSQGVAAFLRRLDALVPLGAMCGPDGGEIYTADLTHLAAAVEEASRDA